jgi:hypothetical protein
VVRLTSAPVASCVIRWLRSAAVDSFFQLAITLWRGDGSPRSRYIGGYCEPVMKKSLPKSDGSSFLLCEDVREEVNNKLSIIGVFPNDDIVLQKEVLIPSLMAVLLARGGEGRCETRVSLTDPQGQTAIESPKRTVVLEKNKAHLAAIRVLAPQLLVGQYTIKFFFDDVLIERTFEVKKA